jgi:outer membrane protein OmpA-like peptidoglycan-associated protein
VLNEYPDLKVEIQGHTDDTGDRDHNLDLSQRRAESVKNYFVGKGVDEARLVAKGYGPDAPLIDKKTKSARAKNRRVEFKLISDIVAPPAESTPAPAPEPAPAPSGTP